MEYFARAMLPVDQQAIRIFLRPVEPSLLAVNAHAEAVSFTRCDLRRVQHAGRTVLHTEEHVRIIVQPPPLDHACKGGAEVGDAQSCHELEEIEGMHADVTNTTAKPRLRRVAPPGGLLVAGSLDGIAEPTLQILDDNLPNLPEITALTDRARFADHWVTRISVRQRVELS